ncbi:MAG: DUF2270 domain-containing protein [Verrucomicrobia bacterium]|nr:DUF2270 domain-containing protein [Verrucomicrobiota bacterium]
MSPPELPPASLKDPCYVNAMAHFYRGELGRIMIWRQRLDVTTTWAITSTTTIIGAAFSFKDIPHIIFFFNLALVWIMLWIESRRYRFYDAFRGRVRMLESHFLVPMVSQNPKILDGEWRKLVCEDLIMPSFKITRLEAIGRRLKRNYVFIFAIIMVAWTMKILINAKTPIHSFGAFYDALAVQELPSWLAFSVYVGTIISITGLTFFVARTSSEEVSEFGSGNSSLWRI